MSSKVVSGSARLWTVTAVVGFCSEHRAAQDRSWGMFRADGSCWAPGEVLPATAKSVVGRGKPGPIVSAAGEKWFVLAFITDPVWHFCSSQVVTVCKTSMLLLGHQGLN